MQILCISRVNLLEQRESNPLSLLLFSFFYFRTLKQTGEIRTVGFDNNVLTCDYSNESTEQYFPVVLIIMLYKVILTFESVDKILKCDHSNESY